jgi:NADPH-dependent 2,4-dienoyl-CoA reductase/sulfur reductase-like enzyme
MKNYHYIIIGGGMTGSSAAMAIRKNDSQGTIAIFSKEKNPPYNRPPLSKGLWSGKKVESILRPMEKLEVDLYLNTTITAIDREQKTVTDTNGRLYHYEKLLIATGGKPIRLPDSPSGLIFYRTLEDFYRLRMLIEKKTDFCVVGGGFIGSEIAAALTNQGKNVTMIFPEDGISGLRFPKDLSEFLNDYYQGKGVQVLSGHAVVEVSKNDDQYHVKYKSIQDDTAQEGVFDGVIVGIGIKPNVKLAQEAGLSVDDGILVNAYLQTDDPDIFAAGDVASYLNLQTGNRERVEHEDAANSMGTTAGQNMTGKLEKYDHFPFFYSDLFDLGFEAVGDLNPEYDIIEDWIEPFKKGTIYYLKDGQVMGVIFWDLWGNVDAGRELIASKKEYLEEDLIGRFT